MKKHYIVVIMAILLFTLSSCGGREPEHKLTFEKTERMTVLDEYSCIAVFTKYTNNSSESVLPADFVNVTAYQKGTEIPIIVPTGEKIKGYIQCDTKVQSGTTTDVIWLFQLNDESNVSIEFSDGQKFEENIKNSMENNNE